MKTILAEKNAEGAFAGISRALCPENGISNRRPLAVRKILVPMTLSRRSHAGLIFAAKLAREADARLVVLHAVHLNIAGEERGIQRTRLLNELARDAELELRQLTWTLCADVEAEIVVVEGRPADAIVETARQLGVDSIVMCQHDRPFWSKWLRRHTAAGVIPRAPCPVWLVTPEQKHAPISLAGVDGRREPRPVASFNANNFDVSLRSGVLCFQHLAT